MTAPWVVEAAPDRVSADLAHWFPGTSVWLGKATGSWWSLARDRSGVHRLVEAATPAELVHRLDGLGVRRAAPPPTSPPKHSPARPAAAPDATVPDLASIAPTATTQAHPVRTRHRAPRRGRLLAALGSLAAGPVSSRL